MFKATLLVSVLFLSSAYATVAATAATSRSTYKLNMDLTLNGKHLASQGLLANEGEKSEVQQKYANGTGSYIVVTPETIEGENKHVHMKFVVGVLVKGQRHILSTPEMIATEGQPSTITVGDDDGPESYTLTVTASRQVSIKK
ncbi:hypothetical protein CIK05_14360 [Bdellovibrio sp. qaytius]|nr:hypothetical protein CIK05_14360 [Bdellovibrio sp. qaytius]